MAYVPGVEGAVTVALKVRCPLRPMVVPTDIVFRLQPALFRFVRKYFPATVQEVVPVFFITTEIVYVSPAVIAAGMFCETKVASLAAIALPLADNKVTHTSMAEKQRPKAGIS